MSKGSRIIPRVDCAFKALFANPDHTEVVLEFLNAILQLPSRLIAVTLEPPVLHADSMDDDERRIDLMVRDQDGAHYLIEMQNVVHAHLTERILYNWAKAYQQQMQRGGHWNTLQPVIAIWVVDQILFSRTHAPHSSFLLHDPSLSLSLSPHLAIHVLELEKVRRHGLSHPPKSLLDKWAAFLAIGETWDIIPIDYTSDALERAMTILDQMKSNAQWSRSYQRQWENMITEATEKHLREQQDAKQLQLEKSILRLEEQAQRLEEQAQRFEDQARRLETEKRDLEAENLRLRQDVEQWIRRFRDDDTDR